MNAHTPTGHHVAIPLPQAERRRGHLLISIHGRDPGHLWLGTMMRPCMGLISAMGCRDLWSGAALWLESNFEGDPQAVVILRGPFGDRPTTLGALQERGRRLLDERSAEKEIWRMKTRYAAKRS